MLHCQAQIYPRIFLAKRADQQALVCEDKAFLRFDLKLDSRSSQAKDTDNYDNYEIQQFHIHKLDMFNSIKRHRTEEIMKKY